MVVAGELLIVFLVALIAVAVHSIVQRRSDYQKLSQHNEVAGFLLSVVGVMYAVVLGFIVIVVWERYSATQGFVQDEVAAFSDVYRLADALPAATRASARNRLVAYVDGVLHDEWPEMSRGIAPGPSPLLEDVAHEVDFVHPSNEGQSNVQQVTMRELQVLFDARRHRTAQATPSVPPILWFALVAGGIVTLGFTFFFGTANGRAQLLMTAALAAMIALLFMVIVEFNAPFSGPVAVQSTGWTVEQSRLQSIK